MIAVLLAVIVDMPVLIDSGGVRGVANEIVIYTNRQKTPLPSVNTKL